MYRRHKETCKLASHGNVATNCTCPIWTYGTVAQMRKNISNRKVFPHDEAVIKILFLNIRNFTNRWTKRQGWDIVMNQLMMIFGDRLKPESIAHSSLAALSRAACAQQYTQAPIPIARMLARQLTQLLLQRFIFLPCHSIPITASFYSQQPASPALAHLYCSIANATSRRRLTSFIRFFL